MEVYLAEEKYKTVREIIENGYALSRDFEMGVLDIQVGMPTLWSHTVYVPGRAEIVDFTDAINDGKPSFKNRTMTVTLDQEERYKWYWKANDFAKKVHGKKFNIMRSDDPDHYLIGRINLTTNRLNCLFNEYTLDIECNPYRYIVPALKETFSLSPEQISELYEYRLGDYCTAIKAKYKTYGTSKGRILIYDDKDATPRQTIELDSGTGEKEFTPKIHGNIKISFENVQKIILDGKNMEV